MWAVGDDVYVSALHRLSDLACIGHVWRPALCSEHADAYET